MRQVLLSLIFLATNIYGMTSGEYIQKLNVYERQIFSIFKNNMDLIPTAFGGGVSGRKQNFILRLQHSSLVEIPEARKLVVNIVEVYLDQMNSHTDLKEFEKMDFPFDSSNINLILGVIDPQTNQPPERGVCVVFCFNNRVIYEAQDGKYRYTLLLEETYDEAKAELIKQGINISQMVEETLKKPPKGGWLKALFSRGFNANSKGLTASK